MGGFPVVIIDPRTGKRAKVINGGAQAVLPPEYNSIFSAELTIADQVYNLVPGSADAFFVGNVLIMTGDKLIAQTDDAVVSIYAARAADEALDSANQEVLTLKLPRSGERTLGNMNIRTLSKGAFINVVSSDINVNVSLFGYYTIEEK